jgi:monomeric isocitrate dehydrogenase
LVVDSKTKVENENGDFYGSEKSITTDATDVELWKRW